MIDTYYTIYSLAHYDQREKLYTNILTVDPPFEPSEPMYQYIKHVNQSKLSPYKNSYIGNCNMKCVFAIMSDPQKHEFWCPNKVPEFMGHLMSRGYSIDTKLTSLLQTTNSSSDPRRLIAMIKYSVPDTIISTTE